MVRSYNICRRDKIVVFCFIFLPRVCECVCGNHNCMRWEIMAFKLEITMKRIDRRDLEVNWSNRDEYWGIYSAGRRQTKIYGENELTVDRQWQAHWSRSWRISISRHDFKSVHNTVRLDYSRLRLEGLTTPHTEICTIHMEHKDINARISLTELCHFIIKLCAELARELQKYLLLKMRNMKHNSTHCHTTQLE